MSHSNTQFPLPGDQPPWSFFSPAAKAAETPWQNMRPTAQPGNGSCGRQAMTSHIKYALIGTALGVAISAGFLALKICMIRKHLFDFDSSDLRSANVGVSDTVAPKKRAPR
ncbi:hypothetical protein MDA_GLEAN10013133 [Myotis davidii]|uniref:Transmembrane protein 273 n=1 Tax=Myotis davidii TaxID=225400 RepID=L5MAC7_MYODS|nr:hypothetical protein MDA_GLEAN10013133 [Myotis davidii]